jgi:mannose-6-phosphate isomerase
MLWHVGHCRKFHVPTRTHLLMLLPPMKLPPLTFKPVLKRIRWGGRKLGMMFGKPIGPEADYAESWEVADHAEGVSIVEQGTLSGRTLNSLVNDYPRELLGATTAVARFPLLIKLLDANDWLSLQVHPNDLLAREYSQTDAGKTEAWVVISAEAGSTICAGLKPGVTRAELQRALITEELQPLLNCIPVAAGDCVFVPAGTIHALGPGILIAEVQQQSNLTFRLHDWGRVGADGKPRQIHVEESLHCTDFSRGPVFPVVPLPLPEVSPESEQLVRCPYFAIRRHQVHHQLGLKSTGGFRVLMCLTGRGFLGSEFGLLNLQPGATVLLPASLAEVSLETTGHGPLTLLEISPG